MESGEIPPPQSSMKSPPIPSSSPPFSSPFSSTVVSSSAVIESTNPSSSSYNPSLLLEFGAVSPANPSFFPSVEPKIEYVAGSSSFAPPPTSPRLLAPKSESSSLTREGVEIPRPLESLKETPIPPFLSKTYDLVDDPRLDPVISWGRAGESFVVWDIVEFSRAVLPRHFKHSNFSSFVRQLNTYGFRKIDTDRWEFANKDFLRGKRSMLKNICRNRSSQVQQVGTQIGSSVEMRKFELAGELQNLRREKNLMMQEVVRLKQEHLVTVQQIGALNQRLQSAELRQKHMVSFLAKVLQNPVCLAHFKQQKEDKEIASRVKRKFIKQQQPRLNLIDHSSSSAPQGIEGGTGKQLPDHISEDLDSKLCIDASGQEALGGSDEPGARMLDQLFLDSNTDALANFQTDVAFSGIEYFISSAEDNTPDKMFSDALAPASESISMIDSNIVAFKGKSVMNSKTDAPISGIECPTSFLDQEKLLLDPIFHANIEEEIGNVGFEAEGTSFSPAHDIWDVHYNTQGFEADGPCALWDLDLHTPEEGLEIDKYVGGESSSQDHKNEAGVLNEDRTKDLEP